MAEIPGIVWLFVGIFLVIASVIFGNKTNNLMRFAFFIVAGSVMILVGVLKMLARRGGEKAAGRHCPGCGAGLSGYGQFCPKCGSRI